MSGGHAGLHPGIPSNNKELNRKCNFCIDILFVPLIMNMYSPEDVKRPHVRGPCGNSMYLHQMDAKY